MTYIIYTVVSLTQKDKSGFINWLKDEYDIPTQKPDIAFSGDGICLDYETIYLCIYEQLEKKLLDGYCQENNITEINSNNFINKHFYGYCSIKYCLIEKTLKIPVLKKNCPTDIKTLNKMLENYKYDRLILLLLIKKLLKIKKKKTFYQLNFDALNFDELFRTKLYGLHHILPYYNIALLTPLNVKELIEYWHHHIYYNSEWKHKSNHFIFVDRYKKMVHKLKVRELLCYKLAKTDYKFKSKTLKNMSKQIAHDDWVNVIDTNITYNKKINSLQELEEKLKSYIFKLFQPATDLESYVLGCCNRYAEDNKLKYRDYTKIKRMIKKHLDHRAPNLIIECVEYSKLDQKSKKIRLFKCC